MIYRKPDCTHGECHFSQRRTMASPRYSSKGALAATSALVCLPAHAPSLSRRAFLQSRSQSRAQHVIPNGVPHQFFKTEGAPASSPSTQAAYAPLPSPRFHPSDFFFSSSSHLIFFSLHPQQPTREEHSSHSFRLLSFSIKHSSSLYWLIILHFPAYNLPSYIRTHSLTARPSSHVKVID